MTATCPAPSRRAVRTTPVGLALLLALPAAFADDRRGDGKQSWREGACTVEVEWKRDGGAKTERKCPGGDAGVPERKETVREAGCKVQREWKRNGDYVEDRDCGDRDDGDVRRPAYQPLPPPPVWGPAPGGPSGPVTVCRSEAVGRVIGGIVGAAIGREIAGDGHRTLGTVGGAIAGVLIGGAIGRQIGVDQQACVGQVLESVPAGQRVTWRHEGLEHQVVPGAPVWRDGLSCRPYRLGVRAGDGDWRHVQSTACRRPDGTWRAARA